MLSAPQLPNHNLSSPHALQSPPSPPPMHHLAAQAHPQHACMQKTIATQKTLNSSRLHHLAARSMHGHRDPAMVAAAHG